MTRKKPLDLTRLCIECETHTESNTPGPSPEAKLVVHKKDKETIFRVRFIEKNSEQPMETLVRQIDSSHLPGLVCLSQFVFKDSTKKIILPEEEAAAKRYRNTERLHIPFHNILFVEEFHDEPLDIRELPFLREVTPAPDVN
ncbi:MAG: DUF1820 family protein [Proteobacteria bacterium]|nr:MAG: DUF1820 family protein [Pseudomonadota bacterium]